MTRGTSPPLPHAKPTSETAQQSLIGIDIQKPFRLRPDSDLESPPPRPASAKSGENAILLLFMTTMFLSALLVFAVQPMFAKMVLPLLGGSPGVWNTAMLFFQTVLLVGYVYAHLTTKLLGVHRQAWLHIAVMAAVFLVLPITVASGWTPPVEDAPVPWLIGLFSVSVGFPFFAVATNAPLLQRWFSYTPHSAAADPYFLYGASNFGSILALLGYPFIIEPFFSLQEQSMLWGGGYAVLVGFLCVCSIALWRGSVNADITLPSAIGTMSDETVTWPRRFHWLVLAFVPSSLLLGVTTHITTDVASVPLLWVIPLTLYLLTFVLAFARRPLLKHTWMVKSQPLLLILLAITFHFRGGGLYFFMLHIAAFFVTTMVCHGELVKRRPNAGHLTKFYLWMSFGGMLGGVFNVLLAPILFTSVYEYPLALILACLLRPQEGLKTKFWNWLDVGLPLLLLAISGVLIWLEVHPKNFGLVGITLFFVFFALATYSFHERPLRLGLGVAGILMMMSLFSVTGSQILARERSFFGVSTAQRTISKDFNLLIHGNTTHGAQHVDLTRWREPLTYYHREGPIGQVFTGLEKFRTINQLAIVGLGSGTMACYRLPGQSWTYYEIDPAVERLARDTRYFHYMSECAGDTKVVLGDARISLLKAQDKFYDLIIVDAFSSDSIPMHLISRESLALYIDKLAPHGILVFHISNRFLDLSVVMENLVMDAGLSGKHQRFYVTETQQKEYKSSSEWVVMARTDADLEFLEEDSRWDTLKSNPTTEVWTDDFSNILSGVKWP